MGALDPAGAYMPQAEHVLGASHRQRRCHEEG